MAVRSFFPEVVAGRRAVTASEKAKLGAAYDGSVAYLDDVVGGLLERFAAEPWYDQSLIIITADHGEQLGEKNQLDHGNGVDHGATSIPMIVKFPGQTTGRDVQSPVSQVDVFSTIVAAAGVAVPSPRPGVDLGAGDPGEERTLIIESFPNRIVHPPESEVRPGRASRGERPLEADHLQSRTARTLRHGERSHGINGIVGEPRRRRARARRPAAGLDHVRGTSKASDQCAGAEQESAAAHEGARIRPIGRRRCWPMTRVSTGKSNG